MYFQYKKNLQRDLTNLKKTVDGFLESVRRDDPENVELLHISQKLDDVIHESLWKVEYLSKPVMGEGYLTKKSNGRYELEGQELTSGDSIEALVLDEFYIEEKWVLTRVEHNGEDYYIVGVNQPIGSVHVRIR